MATQIQEEELETFLTKFGLSNCLKYLKDVKVTTVDALRKLPANDLKAVGFKPEVRNKLQRALKGQEPESGADAAQEQFVTVEEEEEAAFDESSGKKKSGKKKKSAKPVSAKPGAAAAVVVPGQEGVSLDAEFAELLSTLGLSSHAEVFERNNMTSFLSCRYVTREALVGNFGIPAEKAGILLSQIIQRAPTTHDRRLPELAIDLAAAVASMHVTESVREQVKTALQSNNVLSVASAMSKRYSLMNEVGLSADAATELGRLLDSGPSVWQHAPETFLPAASARHGPVGGIGSNHRIPSAAQPPPPDWPLPGPGRGAVRVAPPQYPMWGDGVARPGGYPGLDQRSGLYPMEVMAGRTMR